MSEEPELTWALKMPKDQYEKNRRNLIDLGVLNPEYELIVEGDYLFVPVILEALHSNLNKISIETEIVKKSLKRKMRKPRNLREALSSRLPSEVVKNFRRSFDMVGDIIVLEPTEDMKKYRNEIVEALRLIHPNVRVILAKSSPISGLERIATYERWYGEGTSETIHKEHGCSYLLDLTRVFFTSRLSMERKRIASLVKPGEIVCDLFAGIGPFSILIAKTKKCKVYASDINPIAYQYLLKNISLNRVQSKVEALLGDARELASTKLRRIANRIIMNLPMGAELYLDAATNALVPDGGIIHLYTFRSERENKDQKLENIISQLRDLKWTKVEIVSHRKVREIGPRLYNEVLDISVSRGSYDSEA